MGLIKEQLDIDFIVDPRPLSKKEQELISKFIKSDKEKRALQKKTASKKVLSQFQNLIHSLSPCFILSVHHISSRGSIQCL